MTQDPLSAFWCADLSPAAPGTNALQDALDKPLFDYVLEYVRSEPSIEVVDCTLDDAICNRLPAGVVGASREDALLIGRVPDNLPRMLKGDWVFLKKLPQMLILERKFFTETEPVLVYSVTLDF